MKDCGPQRGSKGDVEGLERLPKHNLPWRREEGCSLADTSSLRALGWTRHSAHLDGLGPIAGVRQSLGYPMSPSKASSLTSRLDPSQQVGEVIH